jgi:hypothetical protein
MFLASPQLYVWGEAVFRFAVEGAPFSTVNSLFMVHFTSNVIGRSVGETLAVAA